MDCRTRPWLIEPLSSGNKYLYVRIKAIFLYKYNPKRTIDFAGTIGQSHRCETKSRAVLTTAEGNKYPIASNYSLTNHWPTNP